MRRLLSLFDRSGSWSWPFHDRGWDVIQWDIALGDFMDINLLTDAEMVLEMFEDVDGVLAAVPCTEFSVSGAQYWPKKDANGQTEAALELARQTLRLVDLFKPTDPDFYDEGGTFFWGIENPVGRLARLAGLGEAYYFDPCDFAGYQPLTPGRLTELDRIRLKNGHGVTQEEHDLIMLSNAYTKKTGIWGDFTHPVKKRIEPVKGSPSGSPLQRYGGKSDKTKEARSITPAGFAEAFCAANQHHVCDAGDLIF